MTRGIDHLVLCVNDLESARRSYQRLGFTTTPIAHHPWGTANSLVQLQGCFLELLTVTEPGKIEPRGERTFSFGAFNQDFLGRREGISMLVFQSDDARRDQAEFAAKGLSDFAPFDFSRQAKLPGGSEATVAFSLAFVTHPEMPEAAFFTCQQHAPQYFWNSDYQRHANGAHRVSEVMMAAERPSDFAAFFRALQGADSVQVDENRLLVTTPLGKISLETPTRLAERFPGCALPAGPETPHFVGYGIAVPDLGRAERIWTEAGFSPLGSGPLHYLDPARTHGTIIALLERFLVPAVLANERWPFKRDTGYLRFAVGAQSRLPQSDKGWP